MEERYYLITALFRKTVLGVNGKKENPRQTIRIVRAKDSTEAKDKFNKFWADKMRSYSIMGAEITEEL